MLCCVYSRCTTTQYTTVISVKTTQPPPLSPLPPLANLAASALSIYALYLAERIPALLQIWLMGAGGAGGTHIVIKIFARAHLLPLPS